MVNRLSFNTHKKPWTMNSLNGIIRSWNDSHYTLPSGRGVRKTNIKPRGFPYFRDLERPASNSRLVIKHSSNHGLLLNSRLCTLCRRRSVRRSWHFSHEARWDPKCDWDQQRILLLLVDRWWRNCHLHQRTRWTVQHQLVRQR